MNTLTRLEKDIIVNQLEVRKRYIEECLKISHKVSDKERSKQHEETLKIINKTIYILSLR